MRILILVTLIILVIIFGVLSVISIAITGANSFTRTQRKKYPILKKLDGKQIYFVTIAAVTTILFFLANGLKEIVTLIPPVESEVTKKQEPKSDINLVKEEEKINTRNSNKEIFNGENQNNKQQVNQSVVENNPKPPQSNLKKRDNLSVVSTKDSSKSKIPSGQSLSKAKNFASKAKYNEAINECDKILRINPNNIEAASLKNWAKKQLQILNQQ